MDHFRVVGLDFIVILFSDSKDFITVLTKIFAWKRDEIGFGIGLHSEVWTGGNFKRYFHIVIFKFLFTELSLKRNRIPEIIELIDEG